VEFSLKKYPKKKEIITKLITIILKNIFLFKIIKKNLFTADNNKIIN
jgi:hypothetical protein